MQMNNIWFSHLHSLIWNTEKMCVVRIFNGPTSFKRISVICCSSHSCVYKCVCVLFSVYIWIGIVLFCFALLPAFLANVQATAAAVECQFDWNNTKMYRNIYLFAYFNVVVVLFHSFYLSFFLFLSPIGICCSHFERFYLFGALFIVTDITHTTIC